MALFLVEFLKSPATSKDRLSSLWWLLWLAGGLLIWVQIPPFLSRCSQGWTFTRPSSMDSSRNTASRATQPSATLSECISGVIKHTQAHVHAHMCTHTHTHTNEHHIHTSTLLLSNTHQYAWRSFSGEGPNGTLRIAYLSMWAYITISMFFCI